MAPPVSPIRKKKDLLPSIHSLRLPTSTSERAALPFISPAMTFLPDPAHLGTTVLLLSLARSLALALSKLDHKPDPFDLKQNTSGDSLLFLNFVCTAALRAETSLAPHPLNA